MTRIILFVSVIFSGSFLFSQDIEGKLKELKDVTFEKVITPKGYVSAYKVFITQLIDHNDASKGTFKQQVWLSHMSFEKQNVIVTQGYESPYNSITEPAKLIGANQMDVEHRFFGNSIPAGMDYKYLTIEQATADLHHIREVFSTIYKKDWISTGISKGGETTVYYRYFFPNDVKVSIPYVAPLALSTEDPRIYHFFDTVNTAECRKAVMDFQTRILSNRKKSERILKKINKKDSLSFTYLTFDQAFEYAVLEYSFSFWQWNGVCADIPTKDVPLKEALEYDLPIMMHNLDVYCGKYNENKNFTMLTGDLETDCKNLISILNPPKIEVPENLNIKLVHILLDPNHPEDIPLNSWKSTVDKQRKSRDLWESISHKFTSYVPRLNVVNRTELPFENCAEPEIIDTSKELKNEPPVLNYGH